MDDRLWVRLLGPLVVTVGHTEVGPEGSFRRSLFGLLALHANEVVGMGELVAICAAFGIGHVALPTSPGLGQAGVGSVLEVADALARAWPRVIKRAGKSFMVSRPKPIGGGDTTRSTRDRAGRR